LDEMKMSETERKAYQKYLKRLRDIASEQHTKMADAEEMIRESINKGRKESQLEIAKSMKEKGFDNQTIQELTGLSKQELEELK
ncbi:MAG: hypothetical protein K1X92_18960, partial [Bacteroidia bacterium]|nr:hypothetical protein [Bacteroidia bacterium]